MGTWRTFGDCIGALVVVVVVVVTVVVVVEAGSWEASVLEKVMTSDFARCQEIPLLEEPDEGGLVGSAGIGA